MIAVDHTVDKHKDWCTGVKAGMPVCACRMEHVMVMGGQFVEVKVLGPVENDPDFFRRAMND